MRDGSLIETFINQDGNETTHITPHNNEQFNHNFELYQVGTQTGSSHGKRTIYYYSGSTSIPVFDNDDAINAYITNGDTSGAITIEAIG